MKICSHFHEEIVFDNIKCPLCISNAERDALKDEVLDLTRRISDLEEEHKP